MRVIPHYIAGKEVIKPGKIFDVFDPGLGQKIGLLYAADKALVEECVDAARKAQSAWAITPPIKRAKIFQRFAQIIEEREYELALSVSLEHGKTIEDAKASIARGLEIIHYHCGIQQQLQGTYSHQVSHDVHTHTFYQPLGICCGVSPFNFPVMVPLWMLAPAIATGNAFILKPSEKTPSASLKLIQWFEEAGLPKGLAQCLQGDAETVQQLLEHPDIAAYTAVGSSKAAHHIYAEATKRGKRAHTFGGAKNHAIVMPDAELQSASAAIISAAFGSAGQRCMALSAVITVGAEVRQKLLPILLQKAQQIKVGPAIGTNATMGPLISHLQLERLKEAVFNGKKEGAKLLLDGSAFKHPKHPNGFFLGPCIFDEVTPSMHIYQEELFGPILVILNAQNEKEALDWLNASPYGNGAVIFTQKGASAQAFVNQAQAGMIGVNVPVPVPIVSHPFGGWKQSSFGDRAMHALESIHFYTKQKTVTTTWPKADNAEVDLNMPHH